MAYYSNVKLTVFVLVAGSKEGFGSSKNVKIESTINWYFTMSLHVITKEQYILMVLQRIT